MGDGGSAPASKGLPWITRLTPTVGAGLVTSRFSPSLSPGGASCSTSENVTGAAAGLVPGVNATPQAAPASATSAASPSVNARQRDILGVRGSKRVPPGPKAASQSLGGDSGATGGRGRVGVRVGRTRESTADASLLISVGRHRSVARGALPDPLFAGMAHLLQRRSASHVPPPRPPQRRGPRSRRGPL